MIFRQEDRGALCSGWKKTTCTCETNTHLVVPFSQFIQVARSGWHIVMAYNLYDTFYGPHNTDCYNDILF